MAIVQLWDQPNALSIAMKSTIIWTPQQSNLSEHVTAQYLVLLNSDLLCISILHLQQVIVSCENFYSVWFLLYVVKVPNMCENTVLLVDTFIWILSICILFIQSSTTVWRPKLFSSDRRNVTTLPLPLFLFLSILNSLNWFWIRQIQLWFKYQFIMHEPHHLSEYIVLFWANSKSLKLKVTFSKG